jgi:hypothetical protein
MFANPPKETPQLVQNLEPWACFVPQLEQ